MVFHWAALVLDAWLAVTRPMRDLLARRGRFGGWWRLLPGDMLGRLVMLGCGIPAPTRVHNARGMQAVLVEDPRVGLWFRAHAMPVTAQTLGRYVFSRGPISDHILAHECEHIRQWDRFGPFFLPLYLGSSAVAMFRGRRPYWDNRFEASARTQADRESAAATGEDETRLKT